AVFSVLQFAVVLAAVVVSGVTAARTQRALRLRETPPARLTRADAVPVAVMLAVVALVVAPILTLVVRSFHTRHGWGLGNYELLSTSAGSGFVGGSTPAQALEQSLRVAVDATLVTLVVA
ncbi:iron ABC transporter permease, partial [Xanthomonas citri pv. citri]|nr:iron ABC transporter permease [Xanthomonas citri pv. citri]